MPSRYPAKPIEKVGARRTTKGGAPQKYFLDDPGRNLIVALYDGSRGRVEELHRRLGVPRYVVCKWAAQMGLAHRKYPRWTEEELVYLERTVQSQTFSEIAAYLGRTETAVHVKANKLGLSKFDEGYTMAALCEGLGCHHETAMRWVKQGWLKGAKRNTGHVERDPWLFTDKGIRDFLRNHPDAIDLRRVDQLWFLDVCLDLGALDNPRDH